jgi:hypothetical protein
MAVAEAVAELAETEGETAASRTVKPRVRLPPRNRRKLAPIKTPWTTRSRRSLMRARAKPTRAKKPAFILAVFATSM